MRLVSTYALGIALVTASISAHAYELIACRMPNGDIRIAAVPPEGCVVDKPSKLHRPSRQTEVTKAEPAPLADPPLQPRVEPAPAPPEQPALTGDELVQFDGRAIMGRRAIERRAEDIGEKLERHRESIASLPPIEPENYENSPRGLAAYVDAVRARDAELQELRTEELAILDELDSVKDEFAALSADVAAAHGGELPPSWPPKMSCDACPRGS